MTFPLSGQARRHYGEGNAGREELRDEGGDAARQPGSRQPCHRDGIFRLCRPWRSPDGYQVSRPHRSKTGRPPVLDIRVKMWKPITSTWSFRFPERQDGRRRVRAERRPLLD